MSISEHSEVQSNGLFWSIFSTAGEISFAIYCIMELTFKLHIYFLLAGKLLMKLPWKGNQFPWGLLSLRLTGHVRTRVRHFKKEKLFSFIYMCFCDSHLQFSM